MKLMFRKLKMYSFSNKLIYYLFALTTCVQFTQCKMFSSAGIYAVYCLLLIMLVIVSSSRFDSQDITTGANIMEQEMLILSKHLVSLPFFVCRISFCLCFCFYACTVVIICIRIIPLLLNIRFNLGTLQSVSRDHDLPISWPHDGMSWPRVSISWLRDK